MFALKSLSRLDFEIESISSSWQKARHYENHWKVSHSSPNSELFEFGLQLEDFEFISWLSLRMGENGDVITATVHKEKEAKEIFDTSVGQPKGRDNVMESLYF